MKRCTECILPVNYSGISFDQTGTCNYCKSYRPINYLGSEALKEAIKSFQPASMEKNKEYDCIIALSGGRDSSYLLYYLAKTLNLKVVAYCVDNGFMPEQTRINIEKMVEQLHVKLVVEEHIHLKKCIKHHLQAWMFRPSAEMVGTFCTGCRLDIDIGVNGFARKSHIPVIVSGSTPFEGGWYKRNMLKLVPGSNKASTFILGYLRHLLMNPKFVMNPDSLKAQIGEYLIHFHSRKASRDLLGISPFNSYIRWVENEIVSTIENELHWKKRSDTSSTWRADCDVALLKLFMYKKFLGFNDKDDGFSCLIRDKQLSREESLSRIEDEGNIPERIIKETLAKFGLGFPSGKQFFPISNELRP